MANGIAPYGSESVLAVTVNTMLQPIWDIRRIEVLTRRRVYKQQEAEPKRGKQA